MEVDRRPWWLELVHSVGGPREALVACDGSGQAALVVFGEGYSVILRSGEYVLGSRGVL